MIRQTQIEVFADEAAGRTMPRRACPGVRDAGLERDRGGGPGGAALGNPVLQTQGRVTLIDGILATAVLTGLPPERRPRLVVSRSGPRYALVCYAAREARENEARTAMPRQQGYREPDRAASSRGRRPDVDAADRRAGDERHGSRPTRLARSVMSVIELTIVLSQR